MFLSMPGCIHGMQTSSAWLTLRGIVDRMDAWLVDRNTLGEIDRG
jgi:hypothetical protein